MTRKGLLYLLTITLMLFVSCKSEIPSGVIPPEAMKSIIFDLMVAEQIERADTSSATRLHLRDSTTRTIKEVLAIHKVSKTDYMKSLDFYESDPHLLKKLLDSTKAYGAILQDTLRKKIRESNRPVKLDSIVSPDSTGNKINDSTGKVQKPLKLRVPANSAAPEAPKA